MVAGRSLRSRFGKRVSKAWLDALQQEGVVFRSPSVWATAKAPYKAELSRGKVIVTNARFVATLGLYVLIDLPRQHPMYQQLQFDRTRPNWFGITVPLPTTGTLKLRYHFPSASALF